MKKENYREWRKENSPSYIWGGSCRAWTLQQSDNVIIKEEMMPPGAAEQLHFHEEIEQFFYILTGLAHFSIDGNEMDVNSGEGISIDICCQHKISNQSELDLHFLVISAPGKPNDRIEVG